MALLNYIEPVNPGTTLAGIGMLALTYIAGALTNSWWY